MKKLIYIVMLIMAVLASGVSVDAKTAPKKKVKTTVAAPSSALWNGDIPSAAVLYSWWAKTEPKYTNDFIQRNYKNWDEGTVHFWEKPEVCKMSYSCGSDQCHLFITVYDQEKKDWLYNDLKKFISGRKLGHRYFVELRDDGTIDLFEVL